MDISLIKLNVIKDETFIDKLIQHFEEVISKTQIIVEPKMWNQFELYFSAIIAALNIIKKDAALLLTSLSNIDDDSDVKDIQKRLSNLENGLKKLVYRGTSDNKYPRLFNFIHHFNIVNQKYSSLCISISENLNIIYNWLHEDMITLQVLKKYIKQESENEKLKKALNRIFEAQKNDSRAENMIIVSNPLVYQLLQYVD